jgi:hypothetical protein
MREYAMSLKLRSTLTAALLIAPLAVALVASSAVSASADTAAKAHRLHHAYYAPHRWHHQYPRQSYARRGMPAYYDYNHPAWTPGYVFIPGRGIAGEACDMPTSTCSNLYRNVQ